MDKIARAKARVAKIFGAEKPPKVNKETLLQYRQYILDHFDRKTILMGCEKLRWEEYYLFGPGDEDEYEKLKKTRPSHTDEYRMIDISENIFEEGYGSDLLVKVRRLPDRRQFFIELLNLEVVDEDLKEFQL